MPDGLLFKWRLQVQMHCGVRYPVQVPLIEKRMTLLGGSGDLVTSYSGDL